MTTFNFEDLEVWQRAITFADQVIELTESLESARSHYRLVEQLEAASTSVAMNIAEGKGRFSKREFVHFLYIARGSLFETVTLLRVFEGRGWIKKDRVEEIIIKAAELARMLNSLINAVKSSS